MDRLPAKKLRDLFQRLKARRNGFHSIREKLSISSTLIILLLIVLLELCVSTVVTQLQYADAIQVNRELVDSMGISFDNIIAAFKRQINFVTYNSEFQKELQVVPTDAASLTAHINDLRSVMVLQVLAMSEVEGAYLYDTSGELITFWQKHYRSGDPFIILSSMDRSLFTASGKITSAMQDKRLTFNRTIRDKSTLKQIGYISFIYDQDALQKQINTFINTDTRFVIVLNEKNEVIAHNSKSPETLQSAIKQSLSIASNESETLSVAGIGKALVSNYHCKGENWRIICVVAREQLIRSQSLTRQFILLLGVLTIAIAIAVQTVTSRKIAKPIHQIVDTVRRVEEGDYSTPADVHTNDEIMYLADSVNSMIHKIDVLINQNLRGEIRFRDAQMIALQAQINPHFLYNTLECINSLAQLGRKEDVRRVTLAFSNMMKSLISSRKMVTIREEIDYSKELIEIYQVLLGDRLTCSFEVDPEFANVEIPRLMIQPIIENAVLHGIKPSQRKGHLSVGVSLSEHGILFSVSDDGCGIPANHVAAIQNYYAHPGEELEEEVGFGLRNVIDRIKLLYGDAASFGIQSSLNWGTIVHITIPYEQE